MKMYLLLFSLVLLPQYLTSPLRLEKRVGGTGLASYYGNNNNPGNRPPTYDNPGACGRAFLPGSVLSEDRFVAINRDQWDNGAHCGKCMDVSYGGVTIQTFVTDLLPSRGNEGIDISLPDMSRLLGGYTQAVNAGIVEGVTWNTYDCGTQNGANPTSNPQSNPELSTSKLVLWDFCDPSESQCATNCCSTALSNDGQHKCHESWICDAPEATQPPTSPVSGNNLKPMWDFCEQGYECESSCCSKRYSDDGMLKCHDANHCDADNQVDIQAESESDNECARDTWEYCSVDDECSSGCCSNELSDDFPALKCHPGDICKRAVHSQSEHDGAFTMSRNPGGNVPEI